MPFLQEGLFQCVHITARLQVAPPVVLFKPQPLSDTFPDVDAGDSRDWLCLQKSLGIGGRQGKHQLEVFAVRQSVVERRASILDRPRRITDRDSLGAEHGTAAAFFAEVMDVGRQAVTDIDHRMEMGKLMELESFSDARRKA